MRLSSAAQAVVDRVLASAQPGSVVVFDADGTLWRGDAGEELLRYLIHQDKLPRYPGRKDLYQEYERRLGVDPVEAYGWSAQVMADMLESELQTLCSNFFEARFAGRLFPWTRPLIDALQGRGLLVWICSASPRWIIEPGARLLGVKGVIAVETRVVDGRLTDALLLPVPAGVGKVGQLKARGLAPVLGVGNGELDLPMLAFSQAALVIAPHADPGNRLVLEAKARGWPVQRG